jgi:phosphotransferase system  glucose/maltose/N-acetylglucosamine-specific IIC component
MRKNGVIMRRTLILIVSTLNIAVHTPMYAQDEDEMVFDQEENATAAAQSSHTARQTSWQNWVFAGGALLAAAIGVAVVAINTGTDSPTHQ